MNKSHSAIAVSPSGAAAMLGISRTKLYQLLNSEIPVRKIGRRTLIAVADIQLWLESKPIAGSARPSRRSRH
jgi:excisionase family DNA binding protein